jgi:VIT1/CCC1 family predicted Fe2+/Mn2+ transporter
MKKPAGILAGKKTYVTAVLGLLGAVAAYLTGEATGYQTGQTVWACLTAIFLRNGINK